MQKAKSDATINLRTVTPSLELVATENYPEYRHGDQQHSGKRDECLTAFLARVDSAGAGAQSEEHDRTHDDAPSRSR
jgi:hypothetical protein